MEQLATVEQVKAWGGIIASTADDMLARLVASASRFVLEYLQRDSLARRLYTEMYNGNGNTWLMLRNGPVISVDAVSVSGTPIPAASGDGISSPYSSGFVYLGQQRLQLFHCMLPRGVANVFVQYTAGHAVQGESHTLPTTGPLTVTTSQMWSEDIGVTVDGIALDKVNGTPGDMEYSVASGVYTFNAGQAGEEMLLSYSYVPEDINQAVVELATERYKYRDRIGQQSKSLGGQETVSFSANKLPPHIHEILNSHKRVVPL